MMAKAVEGRSQPATTPFIKGDKGDPNADFLFSGITEVLKPAMDAGKIKNVGESYSGRLEAGQRAKEHGTDPDQERQQGRCGRLRERRHGGGVVAALTAQGLAGVVPVSGQDGDHAAINRIALGTQTVSIWKDSRDLGKLAGESAAALAAGKKMTELPNVKPFSGGAKHVTVNSVLLTPLAVTKDNLNVIVDKGWITKAEVCAGVDPAKTPYCK